MDSSEKYPATFPISLKLAGRRCLVVGGGAVALRKVLDLLAAGARVRVVSFRFDRRMEALSGDARVELVRRGFEQSDVDGSLLVIAATDDREVNRKVASAARRFGVLVNVVDSPEECDFFIPAILREGGVEIAVSTGGRSPAMSAYLRDKIRELIGPEYSRLAELLGRMRPRIKERVPAGSRGRFYDLVFQSAALRMIREGKDESEIISEIERCISSVSA